MENAPFTLAYWWALFSIAFCGGVWRIEHP